MADIDKLLGEIPTIDYHDQPYNRIVGYKDKPKKLVIKRTDDRTIRSVYVPKEIHFIIKMKYRDFIENNNLSYGEELLIRDFAEYLLRRFADV